MKKATFILALFFVFVYSYLFYQKLSNKETDKLPPEPKWKVLSVDTVKYSRDLARQKLNSDSFPQIVDTQVKDIADLGVTHIAIATPYDEEFVPFLKLWVDAARRYGIKVWFRGNFSGWEGWFDYPKIGREEHKTKIAEFISKNNQLFEDGDLFSSCTECENGGPGDPRDTGDIEGYRQFIIDEYKISKESFRLIGKNVASNLFSMNGDVAKLVMDKSTTQALGGIVVVDHYVDTPEKLDRDLRDLAFSSGGRIILGEFGVPVPDINGQMDEDQQAEWVDKALSLLEQDPAVIGLNYWTNLGGSTQIWQSNGTIKKVGLILRKHFTY